MVVGTHLKIEIVNRLRAIAVGSFGCAQDDETGKLVKSVSVPGAVAVKYFLSHPYLLLAVILSVVEGSISNSGKQKSIRPQANASRPPTTDYRLLRH